MLKKIKMNNRGIHENGVLKIPEEELLQQIPKQNDSDITSKQCFVQSKLFCYVTL